MHSREPLEQVDSAMRGRNLKVGRSRKQSKQAKLEKSFRDGWRKFEQHRWKGESASSGPSSSGRGELDSEIKNLATIIDSGVITSGVHKTANS